MKQILKRMMVAFLVVMMLIGVAGGATLQAATYRNGSRGKVVRNLQQNLAFLGFSAGTADGSTGI